MPQAAASDKIERYVWKIAAVVVVGSIMSILDTTIVNVALQTLHTKLHSSLADIQWVITGYLLALAAVIPVSGWAARRFGAKNVYIFSIVMFTVGSALCGLAASTTGLVVFRVLQGVGGGMIMPVGQMILAGAAGPQRMGRVMAITGMPMMIGPIIGPVLGGAIIDGASWRWIFYVNVPIGVFATLLGWRLLPARPRDQVAPRLDIPGLLMLATGLPLFTYGLAEVGLTGGFSSDRVIIPVIGGIALIAAFIWHALRTPAPLLDLRLFKRSSYAAASVALFCVGAALFGGLILLPLYFQDLRHESVLNTGLLLVPQGFGTALVMPFAGGMADRIGGGPLAVAGVIIATVAGIPFGLIGPHTSYVWLGGVQVLRGVGIGLAFMPAFIAALATLTRDELPDAAPQLNVLMRVGGSIGTAILAVVLQRALTSAGRHPTAAAVAGSYGTAFWWSLAMIAAALVPCVILVRAEHNARRARRDVVTDVATDVGPLVEAVA